jgi:hypothetical protein
MTRRENKLHRRDFPSAGDLVFGPERRALQLHQIQSAIEHSRTWG